jgi:hypothetical protein
MMLGPKAYAFPVGERLKTTARYLFSFMVGAAHYGLIVGRKLKDTHKLKNIYTSKIRKSWPLYTLPKPAYLTSKRMSKATCLICLIQFVFL